MKISSLPNRNTKQTNYCFIFQNKELLLIKQPEGFAIPTLNHLDDLHANLRYFNALDLCEDLHCFCGEISLEKPLDVNFVLLPLKKAFHELDNQWFSKIVKSLHIIDWDKQNQFCGICGQSTTRTSALYEAQCKSCNILYYPRISPSIIVLIKKDNQILMARGPHFNPGVYGLIAGYVSPGETFEQTVEREVMEEVGIKIKNIRYFGSQPWPFPDSLMTAFTADYDSGEIHVDNVEIIEAGWYGADNLPGFPSSSLSIARSLIDHFLKQL